MDTLKILKTEDTPGVILDKKEGIFEISGRSLPEDSVEFYSPIFQWLRHYSGDPNANTRFVFKLEYANTASSKMVQDLLSLMEKIKGTTIIWYYLKDDEDMEAMGHELSELVVISFEFKSY